MTVKEIYHLAMSGYVPQNVISSKDTNMFGEPSHNRKSIIQYDSKGRYIARYYSLTEAETETGISSATISKCLHGKFPYAGKQHYIFRFADRISNFN